ncbi:MAG TPA: cyclopropane-fatty-acyl-phospholipid synthase family protein [Vitreimonas sp.]|nr:cyclopropane-fatty-acyl-phospholipid synthase family protein [Vitreimonas sp.]
MLQNLLSSIFRDGQIMVRAPNGALYAANGARDADCPLIVHIRDNKTLWRILRHPELAVGEAYMDGGFVVERGTIYDFLALAARNGRNVKQRRRSMTHKNPRKASRKNVAHHYDLSGDLYRLFLDADRQYSCAYFAQPDMTIDEAQIAKKRHLAAKLLVEPGQKVLDIGSGWGGLALTLAEEYGADVTGVTLSTEQLEESRMRAARRGLQARARFDLRDYRDLQGTFDRIISVGMFEHVGPAHYQEFFDTVAARLDEKGVAVVHTIGNFRGPSRNNPWIEKYIFPGGMIPALSQITPAVERSGLIITDVEILRLHYAETLKAWRERFVAHWDEVRALYDESFCRMWEFYLAGAEAGFREGDLAVFQIQMAKDRNVVPLTRDYITDADRAEPTAHRIAAE